MKDSRDVLSSIAKTVQMGQVGIRSVMKNTLHTDLRAALKSQLQEYDKIEREAKAVASMRGYEIDELDPSIKFMAGMVARTKLKFGNASSKTAAMMIQGNTRGVIKGLKNLHRYPCSDQRVSTLAQKLIDCEKSNIQQMQEFL